MSSVWGDAENLSCYLSFNLRAPPTLGNREQGVSICIQYNWTEKCLLEGLHLLRDFFFPPSPSWRKHLQFPGEHSHWEGKMRARKAHFLPKPLLSGSTKSSPPSFSAAVEMHVLTRIRPSFPCGHPYIPMAHTGQAHWALPLPHPTALLHCSSVFTPCSHCIFSCWLHFYRAGKKMITYAILLNSESGSNTIYTQHKNKNANKPQNTTFFGTVSDLRVNNPSIRAWKKQLLEPYRGAFASLTSHTLFFQMNLRLFLSKSPQK